MPTRSSPSWNLLCVVCRCVRRGCPAVRIRLGVLCCRTARGVVARVGVARRTPGLSRPGSSRGMEEPRAAGGFASTGLSRPACERLIPALRSGWPRWPVSVAGQRGARSANAGSVPFSRAPQTGRPADQQTGRRTRSTWWLTPRARTTGCPYGKRLPATAQEFALWLRPAGLRAGSGTRVGVCATGAAGLGQRHAPAGSGAVGGLPDTGGAKAFGTDEQASTRAGGSRGAVARVKGAVARVSRRGPGGRVRRR